MPRFFVFTLLGLLASPLHAAIWYLSPNGDDGNSGSAAAPWASFAHALSRMAAGDELVIADGSYDQRIVIRGREQLTLRAANRGQARVAGGGSGPVLELQDCAFITVDGLRLSDGGENNVLSVDGTTAPGLSAQGSSHDIVLRNLGIEGSCLQYNCAAAAISRSSEVVFEDSWIFGAGRYSLLVYGARNVTVRRLVVRWDRWEGGAYKVDDPRHAMNFYNTRDSIFENVYVLDAGRSQSRYGDKGAISIGGNANGDTPWDSSSNNLVIGSLLINNIGNGISIESPVMQDNNRIRNVLIHGSTRHAVSLNKQVRNTLLRHLTVVRSGGGIGDWSSGVTGTGVYDSLFVDNANAQFNGDVAEDWNVLHGNAENRNGGSLGPHDTTGVRPDLNNLLDPRDAGLSGRVSAQSEFNWPGAHVLERYQNGVATNVPLWPWPNETLIREDLCDAATLGRWLRTGDNQPGWCSSGMSLEAYARNPPAPPMDGGSAVGAGSGTSGTGGGGGGGLMGLWLLPFWLSGSRASRRSSRPSANPERLHR